MKIERIIIGILLGYIIYGFLKKRNIDLKKEILNLLFTDNKKEITENKPDIEKEEPKKLKS